MTISRSSAILLATAVFLGAAPVAEAAGSKLSTQPPSSIPSQSSNSARHAAQSAQAGGTLPRTGLDLAAESFVAALLIAGGTAVRMGSAALPD